MNVNAWGKFNVMRAVSKQMIAQGKREEPYKIINVGSIAPRMSFDDIIPYSMAKPAVLASLSIRNPAKLARWIQYLYRMVIMPFGAAA